jgi:hypothetical protein
MNRLHSRFVLQIVVVATALVTTYSAGRSAQAASTLGDRPMICQSLDAVAMRQQFAYVNSGRLYAPSAAARYTTRFVVTPPRPLGNGALILIKSNRLPDWLYRGPIAPEIAVRFDSRLGSDGGGDTLTFYLLDPVAGLVCAWMNEAGEAYWRDGRLVEVRLLDEGDFGPQGLFRQFEVTLR